VNLIKLKFNRNTNKNQSRKSLKIQSAELRPNLSEKKLILKINQLMKQLPSCCKTKCHQSPKVKNDEMDEINNIQPGSEEGPNNEMEGMSVYLNISCTLYLLQIIWSK